MGNPRREFILFKKIDYWELWQCYGNRAWMLGNSDTLSTNEPYLNMHKKDLLCKYYTKLGFTKQYTNKDGAVEYLFILGV